MSEIAERYRRVADQFTERVRAVPESAWETPSPCEGWVARDVVRHLVEWVPSFFENFAAYEIPTGPSVDDDPVAAWTALDDGLQAALDDTEVAARRFEVRGEEHSIEQAIGRFVLGDVLIHTWDLARATGLDERLDPDEVHVMALELEGLGDLLEQSGQYGRRVEVPDDADEQTKVLASTGRQP
jgi:uncharacterized protein (TIGR03086 family)